MTTPIYDFVKKYAESDSARLHMPGHKGRGELGVEKYDITEISGADVLYSADGIIAESEDNASRLFGTAHSFYSTQGSTLAILAMLALVVKTSGKKTVLAARNVHRSFINAAALLDITPHFLYPSEDSHLCACRISAEDIERALCDSAEHPAAVYITSPDYLGNIADVEGIAKVCKKHSVPLLVDNAHGAYLKFLPEDIHPISLGAAMCADSAHKTLSVLTGGAYLHISKDYPEFLEGARDAMALFASTSPSYLILSSLDLCNKRLADGYRRDLFAVISKIDEAKSALKSFGYVIEDGEPLKIVINAVESGCVGSSLAESLRRAGVECEFSDEDYLVLMLTPDNSERDVDILVDALKNAPRGGARRNDPPPMTKKRECAMSIRDAVLSRSERVDAHSSVGRICAETTVACPPAVPVVISGERITKEDAKLFEYYGIEKVKVIT